VPYVSQYVRAALAWGERDPETPGELNYAITLEIVAYLDRKGLCYQTINDIRGAVSGALVEFERRIAGPYEDDAIKRNGDVY
jgi:hypothetical protein